MRNRAVKHNIYQLINCYKNIKSRGHWFRCLLCCKTNTFQQSNLLTDENVIGSKRRNLQILVMQDIGLLNLQLKMVLSLSVQSNLMVISMILMVLTQNIFGNKNKGINGYKGRGKYYPDQNAIFFFMPAAFEKIICKQNAYRFQCKLMLEAANGQTILVDEKILLSKGAQFLPYILCNAGNVTFSYFERLKNLDHFRPGRMSRKWQSKSKINLIDAIVMVSNLERQKIDFINRYCICRFGIRYVKRYQ